MKVGDLVRYKESYLESYGIIIEFNGSLPIVSWSGSLSDPITLEEFPSELEVINDRG